MMKWNCHNGYKLSSLGNIIGKKTQTAVIGGGMAGILTAWHLQRAGIRTVVLEAGRVGGGQTKNTTAKITSQHGMFCHKFIEKKGKETAEKYVQANQRADRHVHWQWYLQ